MDSFLKMDIFFVVSTVAVVAVGVFVCLALWKLFEFLSALTRIADDVAEETEAIREDIKDARTHVKREGLRFVHLFSFFKKTGTRVASRKKTKS